MKDIQKSSVKKSKESVPLFTNPVLEKQTRSTPVLTFMITSFLIVVTLSINFRYEFVTTGWMLLTWIMTGVLFWTLVEYLMHRFLFHLHSNSEWVKRFHYIIHGVHHDYPRDLNRLFMPPIPALLIAVFFFCIFYGLMGGKVWVFFPGFVLGYSYYVFLHYCIHRYKPPRFMRSIWRNHYLHHFKYPNKAFGVSSSFWDIIFGSMPPSSGLQKKSNNRSILNNSK